MGCIWYTQPNQKVLWVWKSYMVFTMLKKYNSMTLSIDIMTVSKKIADYPDFGLLR